MFVVVPLITSVGYGVNLLKFHSSRVSDGCGHCSILCLLGGIMEEHVMDDFSVDYHLIVKGDLRWSECVSQILCFFGTINLLFRPGTYIIF